MGFQPRDRFGSDRGPRQDRGASPSSAFAPSRESMNRLFGRSGLRLSDAQLQQFWRFHELLRQRKDEVDLTRLHNFESMVLKLYVDSALVATLVDLPTPLLDLGSGAGFPGIPLKIVRPDVHLVLAESKPDRVEFLRQAVQHLGLQNVDIVPHRVGRKFEGRVAGVITRAVETMQETLSHVAPWLPLGARILFMKGPDCQDEVDVVKRVFGAEYRISLDRPYSIPQTSHLRRLVIVERIAATVASPVELDTRSQARDDDGEDIPDLDDLVTLDEVDDAVEAPDDFDAERDERIDPEVEADRAPRTDARPGPSTVREVREILSATNPTFKQLVALHTGRGIRRAGLALIAGAKPIEEALREAPARCVAWISDPAEGPTSAVPRNVAWYRMSRELLRRVDVIGTGPPLLLIRVPEFPTWSDAEWPRGCTLFVPFQDPENMGAILRSADAFGVSQIVLLAEAANPFHPKSARAAGGSALLRLRFARGPAIAALQCEKAPLLTLSAGGREIGSSVFPETFGLLPGLEGPGLPETLRGLDALRIPMVPGVDSLNAATATAIALFLWRQQMGATPDASPRANPDSRSPKNRLQT